MRGDFFRTFLTCLGVIVGYISSSAGVYKDQTGLEEASEKIHSRQKRYLIFPEGSNVQLVYCLTVGAYGRSGDLVMGLTAALAWELPSKVDSKISNLLARKSRSILFPKMEAFLQSIGFDGRSCVLRALCEAGQRDPKNVGKGTLVQELLHRIFNLPYDGEAYEGTEERVYNYAYKNGGVIQLIVLFLVVLWST